MLVSLQSISLLKSKLRSTGAKILEKESLSKHTTFQIGGPADLFCIADTSEQLVKVVTICRENDIPLFILGAGSNILVSDRGIRGVTIKNQAKSFSVDDEIVRVDSGMMMPTLARIVGRYGLSGGEFMQTIPGTVGGGIHQNARFRHPVSFGTYEGFNAVRDVYIGQLVKSVSILDGNNNLLDLSNKECQFVYEGFFHSGFQGKSDIIIGTKLQFSHDNKESIRKRLKLYASYRRARSVDDDGQQIMQPIDPYTNTRPRQPSGATAGCVFFNTPNQWDHPVGRMIDMCGLKGKRIGNVQISTDHANYIVNLGNARADDVIRLMELCQQEVKRVFGVELTSEIELVGDW